MRMIFGIGLAVVPILPAFGAPIQMPQSESSNKPNNPCLVQEQEAFLNTPFARRWPVQLPQPQCARRRSAEASKSSARSPERRIAMGSLPREAGQAGLNTQMHYPLTEAAIITSSFGWRVHPMLGIRKFHSGIDLAAPYGTPVLAAYGGQVQSARWQSGYGKTVVIQSGPNLRSLYAHLSEISVLEGGQIPAGTILGKVGNTGYATGAHLHFEMRRYGSGRWVAIDPSIQLRAALQTLLASERKSKSGNS